MSGNIVVVVQRKVSRTVELRRGLRGEKGDPGIPGADGAPGAKGDPGEQGLPGAAGVPGERGEKGDQGEPGANGATGEKGDRGDQGEQGAQGLPGADGAPGAAGAPGAKGDKGDQGDPGADGAAGDNGVNGWSPVFALVADGERRVQQIADWAGGGGVKPATGKYVGIAGFVDDIADAVNVRGPGSGESLFYFTDGTGATAGHNYSRSGDSGIQFWGMSNAAFTSYDLSDCPNLVSFWVDQQQAEASINLSGCTSLTNIYLFSGNGAFSLDVSGDTAIVNLDLGNVDVTSLDLTDCTGLQYLYLWSYFQPELDLSALTQLTEFSLFDGNYQATLSTLTLGNLSDLQSLEISGCPNLTSVELSGLVGLVEFFRHAGGNDGLTSIALSTSPALQLFNVQFDDADEMLESIDISAASGLQGLGLYQAGGLQTLNLPAVSTASDIEFTLSRTNGLNLDLHQFAGLAWLSWQEATSTTGLVIPPTPTLTYCECTGAALPENVVDAILGSLDGAGAINGYCDLSGGTSAAPGSVGAAAKASLIAKGWDVTTN